VLREDFLQAGIIACHDLSSQCCQSQEIGLLDKTFGHRSWTIIQWGRCNAWRMQFMSKLKSHKPISTSLTMKSKHYCSEMHCTGHLPINSSLEQVKEETIEPKD
jgi:hypothetical protein